MIDLRLGSCLDPATGLATLDDRSIDAVIADPPYEAEAHSKQRRQKPAGWRDGIGVIEAPLDFEPMTEEERVEVGAHMVRVAKHRILVFCQIEAVHLWRKVLTADGMEYRRTIAWMKPDAMPSLHGKWPGQGFEVFVLATRVGAPSAPVGGKSKWYECNRAQRTGHPSAKPLRLMREIVTDFTEPGDLVLDPYAGSGTTGVACMREGRRFIGWEEREDYHDIARRRLNREPTRATMNKAPNQGILL